MRLSVSHSFILEDRKCLTQIRILMDMNRKALDHIIQNLYLRQIFTDDEEDNGTEYENVKRHGIKSRAHMKRKTQSGVCKKKRKGGEIKLNQCGQP